jgi:hypothetical protein
VKADTVSIISLGVSALALLVSVVMPIVAYFWLDPKLQELRHAPKLSVMKASLEQRVVDQSGKSVREERQVGVRMTNAGRLPAADIKVVFHLDRPAADLDVKVIADPPCPTKVEKSGNSVIVYLDRVIGNGQTAGVTLYGIEKDIEIWVYSNRGAERISSQISGSTYQITGGGSSSG